MIIIYIINNLLKLHKIISESRYLKKIAKTKSKRVINYIYNIIIQFFNFF